MNQQTSIPMPRRAAVDNLFGVERVNGALERAGRTPRLNSDELRALAEASETGALRTWWGRLETVVQDGVILTLIGEIDDGPEPAQVRITQTFPAPVIERVDALAAREGQTRAAIMRRAVAAGLYRLGV